MKNLKAETLEEKIETPEEKAKRHALKEKRMREAFRGNAIARNQLLKHIIHDHVVEKRALTDFIIDLRRLFAFPENYLNCETNYNALFILAEASKDNEIISLLNKFREKLKN